MQYFITASVFIHLIILIFSSETTRFEFANQYGETYNISLVAENKHNAKPENVNQTNVINKQPSISQHINESPINNQKIITKEIIEPEVAEIVAEIVADINTPISATPIAITPLLNIASQNQNNSILEKNNSDIDAKLILNHIQSELKRYFIYPKLAVKKNLQGKVTLGFRVGKSGDIVDIYIAKSSGHAVLDLAAKNSLKKVHYIPKTNMSANKNVSLNLQLPIIYQLQES